MRQQSAGRPRDRLRAMISEASLIVQLPRDGAVDRRFRAGAPPSVASGRVALDRIAGDADGRLGPPEAGEVVMSVLSPKRWSARDSRSKTWCVAPPTAVSHW